MINLLPPASKQYFAAGRVNALLIRYIWITLALFALLGALSSLTYVMLEGAKQTAQEQITTNNANVNSLASVQQRSDALKANLAISKAILDQQTHYSDTFLKISSLMTPGTTISNLSLDQTTYGTPVVLQVSAKSQQAAIDLKKSFQESTLFSDVHFQSLAFTGDTSGTSGTTVNPDYPVNVQMSVIINKEGA